VSERWDGTWVIYPKAHTVADNIAFHVSYLACAMSNPTDYYYQYALQIVDYLSATKDLVIAFAVPEGLSNLTINVFSKASPH
jgi:hypothetical protein